MLVDGLATSMMVMGKSGLDLVEQLPSCEAFTVTKSANTMKTIGCGEMGTWVSD